MAIRNVVKIGDDVLRKRCREVTEFDQRLGAILDDMKETMIYANGVGLAGPQIGLLRRIAVISPDGEEFYELVNPVITEQSGKQLCWEGCLSVPGANGEVERPQKITVKAFDRHGKPFTLKAEDFLANICCHEIDHLDGILFIDKMRPFGK